VRTLGSLTDYRLSWGTKNDGQVEMTGAHTLPSPVSGTERVVPFVQPEAGSGANSEVKSGTTTAQGEPILIVDDNPMFVRVLERLLSRDGYAPRFAENGAAALEKLATMETLRPSAIVCDLHMPKMHGKEFVAHIRSEPLWRSIPIVMLTSDDDVEAEVSLLNLGVDAVVSKTKDPRVLVAHVRRVTREKSQKVAA
jgi:CheY-like chemotaxis protein